MKILITIAFSVILISGKAQIVAPPTQQPQTYTIGKVIDKEKLIVEFYYFLNQSNMADTKEMKYDTTYAIRYQNAKYPQDVRFTTLEFSGTSKNVDSLYKIFESAFSDENKNNPNYSVSFKFNDDEAQITTYKNDSVYFCKLTTENSYFYLTETQVKKLFSIN